MQRDTAVGAQRPVVLASELVDVGGGGKEALGAEEEVGRGASGPAHHEHRLPQPRVRVAGGESEFDAPPS